ncbi:cyclin N-terminal domain-containing protein 1 isoform X2 [Oryzias melastigma]|uniref:cyclin N-terminal domain-containing protein 1 isoform X2 n=1 Tax=Oryzias melastigma TaxID=30732 RepID=UPI000CF7EE05|nr:cyclin N-terminal domain-containing protein 1 isoform X2 [Oryzias melastigma]
MAKRLLSSRERDQFSLKFGQASFDLLSDFLVNFNQKNKENLNSLSKCCGSFKQKRLLECIFLICQELKLDPSVGYHATELLQRFMVKHLTDLLVTPATAGAAASEPRSLEDAIFDQLREKFPLILFSCVQLANKMSLTRHMIDTSTAVCFLHLLGLSVSKKTVLESELMVFKGLEFRLDYPNPLTSVETLLEVLGHNEPSVPAKRLYHLCRHVLQFIALEKAAIYDGLLKVTTQRSSPSKEQREKFVAVTEDCMLLGVGVIAVATFILYFRKWEQCFVL